MFSSSLIQKEFVLMGVQYWLSVVDDETTTEGQSNKFDSDVSELLQEASNFQFKVKTGSGGVILGPKK